MIKTAVAAFKKYGHITWSSYEILKIQLFTYYFSHSFKITFLFYFVYFLYSFIYFVKTSWKHGLL